MQFIGETVQKVNCKINCHRTGFKHIEQHDYCHTLTDHFSEGACKSTSYNVHNLHLLGGKDFPFSERNHPCVTRENHHHTGNFITPEIIL